MKNFNLLKILKMVLYLIPKILVSVFKVALGVLFDHERSKRIKARRKWQSNYDHYTRMITKRKS